jgi:hypothetical protein
MKIVTDGEPKAQETKSDDRGRGQRDKIRPLRTLTTAEAPRKAHMDVFAPSKPELELDQDRGACGRPGR